jgi:26S proteasome regulatory subunit N6
MILDKKLHGTLDQGAGCLEVWAAPAGDAVYPGALGVMDSLSRVVDTLWARSTKVVAV